MRCKHCGCTEKNPCILAEDEHGPIATTSPSSIAALASIPCSWLIPGCCNAPACVEREFASLPTLPKLLIAREIYLAQHEAGA